MDTINSPIHYSFVSGTPESYSEYFQIDGDTGAVRQIKAVDTSTTKMFSVIVKVRCEFSIHSLFHFKFLLHFLLSHLNLCLFLLFSEFVLTFILLLFFYIIFSLIVHYSVYLNFNSHFLFSHNCYLIYYKTVKFTNSFSSFIISLCYYKTTIFSLNFNFVSQYHFVFTHFYFFLS